MGADFQADRRTDMTKLIESLFAILRTCLKTQTRAFCHYVRVHTERTSQFSSQLELRAARDIKNACLVRDKLTFIYRVKVHGKNDNDDADNNSNNNNNNNKLLVSPQRYILIVAFIRKSTECSSGTFL